MEMLRGLALALLLLPTSAWSLTLELSPLPDPGVSGEQLFARIDSLDLIYVGAEGPERADAAYGLAELYIATGMIKHGARAQELLDEVTGIQPARADAAYLSATALARMGYFDRAALRLEALIAQQPDVVEHQLMLGRIRFVESREMAYLADMGPAYQLFVSALARDQESVDALYGSAVTALLVQNYRLASSCAERLIEMDPSARQPLYLAGAAQLRLGNYAPAWLDFLRALASAPQEERVVFLGGTVLVEDEQLVSVAQATLDPVRARALSGNEDPESAIDWYRLLQDPAIRAEVLERWWMQRDPSPAEFQNENELEYWARLVEADLWFAQPETGRRGWDTLTGEVWIRIGRPERQSHWMPGTGGGASTQGIPSHSSGLLLDEPRNVWDWDYRINGVWTTVQFTDTTYGKPNWGVGLASPVDVGVLRHETPFVAPTAAVVERFELGVSISRFARGPESIIETMISVRSLTPVDSFFAMAEDDSTIIEWTLSDAEGEPVDKVLRTVTDRTRLSVLIAASGQPAPFIVDDPRLATIGARVSPGLYQVRVRAIDPRTGLFTAKAYRVRVPEPDPASGLTMSSVQLSHGLRKWDEESQVPAEFVKHGRSVIAAPRAVIEGNFLGVFYELENLGVDGSGQTRFDVEYAVYEATGQIRLLAMLGKFDPDELEEVDLSTVQYLQEQTGVSPQGVVVKGTEMDISGLGAGDYVLLITVNDLLLDQECVSAVAFRRGVVRRGG
jgi:GWxTD domain-containing protein